ncbi:MFS transporter [Paramicrobacterium chengjingii]|uniref:MFS transporter n=1 Tax=Paramicrobacterium chengjingii TaxID=2769067 RepID=A0ABX6YHM3_9MICO|nr:MFS transporter [Microbacterium chengjingii]QPZ38262.1 MFS transporter [Microbacterium chengjingii]
MSNRTTSPETEELKALNESLVSKRQERRAVASGALGSALEWFDFAIYGALSATIFPSLFFSGLGEGGALLASFATFFVGFLARPLGAVVCGFLGDRFGRRPVLLGSFVAMGIASLLIGLLPTGQGIFIATVLVFLRFIQGFSLGGEATGAQLMTMEHAVGSRRGILGSFMNIGSPISQVLANVLLAVLSATLTQEAFESWGWRLPFIAAIFLALIGLYIRIQLEETRAFKVQQEAAATQKKVNGLTVLKTQPLTVIRMILQWAPFAQTFYIIAIYGLSFMTNQGGFTEADSFTTLMIANFVSIFCGVFGGWTSDRIGRKQVMWIGCAAMFVGSLGFFPAVNSGSLVLSIMAATVALGGVQLGFGAQPALFAEQFPTATRFTGSALSLNFATLIFAAPAPYIAAWLAQLGGENSYWLVMGVNLGVIIMSAIVTIFISDKNRHRDLAAFLSHRD